ncbi:hypothetical protein XYCOK13_31120 [Xylanibacillus composti]|uniref:Carrier domain-containing protein n=1 Tax=Xylanibacillus composti TaxID=1572762 RepID=A0A8J4H3H3_9BACL|nr:hypothetical protein XYCOK13_31120 [Xylanibacillus composti]
MLPISAIGYEEARMQVKRMLPAPVEFDDDQNLIELGLDSLHMMRLVNDWRRAGAAVSFAELIASPRFGDWWSLLHKSNREAAVTAERPARHMTTGACDPEPAIGPFPLTDVQYAYWIGRRDEQPLGGVGCHAYVEMDGHGVEPRRLESAWKQLLAHHAMLRARFLADGQQEVMETPAAPTLVVHDLRHCSADELAPELMRIRDRLSHRRLAVENGEVAGLALSLLPEGRTRIHFDIDLLVADVQSLHILLRDLAAAYARGAKPAAPANWRFADYLRREASGREAELARAEAYWRERLPNLPAAPGLPLKTRPETIKAPVFARRSYVVSEAVWKRLQQRAAACQVTPAMVLLTAYAEVLDRWSAHSQFLLNIPLFDRPTGEPGLEDVVADFTNLLLLAVDCGTRQSFLERVRSVQAQFHRDAAHAAYSGVQVQRDLARFRQGEREIAPVVFACNLGTPLMTDECRQSLGELAYMISQTPQVWLDFQIYEMDAGLLLAWDAVDALFPDGMMDRMFAAMTRLIEWLAAEHTGWQASPDTLWAAERPRWEKDEERSLPMQAQCLHDGFFEKAAASPGQTALIDSRSDALCSYGELSDYALRVAAFLQASGVREGDPVAVTLPRGIDQIAAVLGILAAGACYVPISVDQPSARRSKIHQKAGIRHVLTDPELVDAAGWPADAAVLSITDAADAVPLTEPADPSPERLAYILFTSGSTGEPKGVEIRHAGAWNTIADLNQRYQVGQTDRIVAVSSLDFDLSVYDIFGLLSAGGSLVLLAEETRRDAARWLKLVNKYEATIWNSVPVLLDMLLTAAESEREKLSSLRLAMLSGDWIGLDLPPRLNQAAEHSLLVAMGGATEASIWSNYHEVAVPLPAHWTSIPYGRPLSNQAYRIVDDKGRDCPEWATGELWIGGAGVAAGYRGEPELTAERFVEWNDSRWYRTGDLGRYWPDGTMEFLGRQDFQVKIRGHRIELGEIETALRQHPGVRDAVVAATGDPRGTRQLAGYVVPHSDSEALFALESVDPQKSAEYWSLLTDAGRNQSREALPQQIPPEALHRFWSFAERLSVCQIGRVLDQAGVFLQPGERQTVESLMHQGGIHARYRELVCQWLGILEEEGMLSKDGTGGWISTRMLPKDLAETGASGRDYIEWEQRAHGLLQYVRQMEHAHMEMLKGEVDPLELFFADDRDLSPDSLIRSMPGAGYRNDIARRVLELAVRERSGAEPIRILEIGARNGELTEFLVETLVPDQAVYTCTDPSAYFLNLAKNRWNHVSLMEYRLLDMNQPPQSQGFPSHSYDIVIAADSLHRVRDIGKALAHIRSLLAPGGLLLMTEMTRNSRLQQISAGYLEDGFTRFEDERAATRLPLLAADRWVRLLKSASFAEAAAFPGQDEPAGMYGQQVIAALAPIGVKRFNPEPLIEQLRRKLPEYMVPATIIPLDQLPLSANGKVDRQALPVPSSLRSVTADQAVAEPRSPVEQELAAMWSRLLVVEPVGLTDNFFTLGGDSLLAIKLGAMARDKFEIELSLGSVFERPTIAQLAERIQALIQEKEQSAEAVVRLPEIVPSPEDRHAPFPLTEIQQAYWVGRSGVYALGNVSTHCYFELEGTDLDLERINRAWQRLIEQHDMMRAVILQDGQRQQILEHVPPYRIAVADLRGRDADAVRAELNRVREEMSHQVLSACEWPLFDVRASVFGNNQVRLHISFDNLLFDGWSMFHLLSEWNRLYQQPDASLSPLALSFRDYVLAMEQLRESELYERDRAYWFNRLPDLPPAPDLPLAQNPESLSGQRFTRLDARLDRDSWRQLKKRTAEAGVTPSGILLAAYAEVLAVWSRQPRFTINLTQFNRLPLHPEVPQIVGDFTSLTLLAADHSSGATFVERARKLQEQLWRDLDHPYVGGVQVQRELARTNGVHNGVAMPVVFTSALGVDQWDEGESGGKWLGKLVYNITQTPQVWLDHQVVEQDGQLLLIWDAVAGLFPSGLLDDMFAAYCQLLRRLAEEEQAWRAEMPALLSIPRLEGRIEANRTEAPVSRNTLDGLFAAKAAMQPDRPAIICSDRILTYEELRRRSDAVAQLLRTKGAKPNTLTAVIMEKGWEQVVGALGILKSGAAYLPVDPAHPGERRAQILRDGNVGVVLTQSWLDERLDWPEGVERIYIDHLAPATGKVDSPDRNPDDLAYVIYTSGSTGVPKGVMIDHRGAVNTILDVNSRFAVGPADRVLALSHLNFDLSVYDMFGMLAAGAAIVMPEAEQTRDPGSWLTWLEQERITVWNTVPALMQMLLEHAAGSGKALPQSLRLVLLSGDWIPLELPGKIQAQIAGVEVIGLGGATEASIWSNLYPIGEVDPSWRSIPYGRPMTNQRYYVLNAWMGDCPVWVPGQLYIGGIGLAQGYWNDEAKTNERFIRHPRTGERLYNTGDLGRYLPDGTIEFLGREDFQVKIRGHRIELGEIEAALKQLDGVKDAVAAVSEPSGDKQLVVYIVPGDGEGLSLLETERVDSAVSGERWLTLCSTGLLQASQLAEAVHGEAIGAFMDYADRLSVAAMCDTLASLGIFAREGERYAVDACMRRYQLHPRYRSLFVHWLDVLAEEGLLRKEGDGRYQNVLPFGNAQHELSCFDWTRFPGMSEKAQALSEGFRRGKAAMTALLRGDTDPRELFLTEDSFLTAEALSGFNLARSYSIGLCRELFRTILNGYPADKEIRVLELGSRAGGLADTLAPLCEGRGRYLYADESSFFTDQAKQKWGEAAPIEYSLFDMNNSPLQQGFALHEFDIIVADNTLHRARNLEATLGHLKRMLAPGGYLIFGEATRNSRLMLTTVGFLEDGFSHFEDERKETCLPLLPAAKWLEALAEQGFARTMSLPESSGAADAYDQCIIMAQGPEQVSTFNPTRLSDALRQKLPDYMVPTSFVLLEELPLSANGKVDRKALGALAKAGARTAGRKRAAPATELQEKLASVWEEVLGCKQVGLDDGFFELGGDSLRAIQCMNVLKERYQIDLSLQDLFDAPNIGQLARLIEKKAAERGQAAAYEEGII